MSCTLVIGSAKDKSFAAKKEIWILTHQKSSSLQEAVFNNAHGTPEGALGPNLLLQGTKHLNDLYPHIAQIPNEKVLRIKGSTQDLRLLQIKTARQQKVIVITIGAANILSI
jgi:thioredoxin reductase